MDLKKRNDGKMSEQMTGAQAAVAQLKAEGVDVILGIPGIHNLSLCDAILDYPEMRFVTGRHEQGITFMANGYARASGRIAVPFVITGPGVTNSLTPLVDAYADSVPMVLVAAQADTGLLGKGAFHELKDQTALLSQVTKWNTRVDCVEEIPEAIRTAFFQAYDGRPGPTAIEIPLNVQTEQGTVDIHPSERPKARAAEPASVREAARMLSQAAAPVVFVGSGAVSSDSSAKVIEIMSRLNAPCYVTALAKGVVPDDHPLNPTPTGDGPGTAGRFLKDADAVLVVGSSLDEATTRQFRLRLPDNLIQIDTCADIFGRHYPVAVPLLGDAKVVLSQLLEELGDVPSETRPSLADRIAQSKQKALTVAQQQMPWKYVHAIELALPRDGFVTNDAAKANGWMYSHLRRYLPRTMNITSNMAALGYAFPAAVGAKLAYPERQAVAVLGDGGYLFSVYSLATAVQHRINVVAIVFDNSGYNTIRVNQTRDFGRVIGADLRNPDFVMLAQAHGAAGTRAENPDQIYDALMAAWERDVPTIIEVPVPET